MLSLGQFPNSKIATPLLASTSSSRLFVHMKRVSAEVFERCGSFHLL